MPRVLVVGPASHGGGITARQGLADCLRERCELVSVETVEQALTALAEGRFSGVISDAGDFGELAPAAQSVAIKSPDKNDELPPLGQALLAQQAGQILNTVGEGVVIVDPSGRSRWMNTRMKQWSPAVHEQVRRTCTEALRHFSNLRPTPTPNPTCDQSLTSKRYHLTVPDEHYLEVITSPVLDGRGHCKLVVAVIFDATGTRRLQQKIDAIDKAGAELVKIESEAVKAMPISERLKLLEEKVISVTRDLMHFDHFNVRLIDPQTNRLELVVASGLPPEALDVELFNDAEANGISGHVARTGKSYICPDVTRDPRYVHGLDGANSSLTVPLTLDDQVIGVFNIESRRTAAFNEDDRQFAEIFARYVAIALSILKLLVTERAATNKKVTADVASEIAGPLNDIALDAGNLLDELPSSLSISDDLRQRVQNILDNVETIRGSIKQAARGPQTVLGARDVVDEPPSHEGLALARVLVVDDEPTMRDVIADVLRKYRAEVTVEQTGQNAIDRLTLSGQTFDLVLSDIRMPDRSGYDVFAAARTLEKPPPVILMTGFGYDPNHCIVRASQEGLQAVLFKPFRVEQLLAEVRRVVAAM